VRITHSKLYRLTGQIAVPRNSLIVVNGCCVRNPDKIDPWNRISQRRVVQVGEAADFGIGIAGDFIAWADLSRMSKGPTNGVWTVGSESLGAILFRFAIPRGKRRV